MVRVGKPVRMSRQVDDALAKEQVAAHQASCGCHEIIGDADTERSGEKCLTCGRPAVPDALDGRRHEWHLDPLCKVQPEARG